MVVSINRLLSCASHRFHVTAARPTTHRDDQKHEVTDDTITKLREKMKWDEKGVPHTSLPTLKCIQTFPFEILQDAS